MPTMPNGTRPAEHPTTSAANSVQASGNKPPEDLPTTRSASQIGSSALSLLRERFDDVAFVGVGLGYATGVLSPRLACKILLTQQGVGALGRVIKPYVQNVSLMDLARNVPMLGGAIETQLQETERSVFQARGNRPTSLQLPEKGSSKVSVLAEIRSMAEQAQDRLKEGRVAGGIYTDQAGQDKGLGDLYGEVTKLTFDWNPMHLEQYPDVVNMENDVAQWIGHWFGGGLEVRGAVTGGGTDSILEACLAYCKKAKARGVDNPVLLMPHKAHAAFKKGAAEHGYEFVIIPTDEESQVVSLPAMEAALHRYGERVMAVVGSLPGFPDGLEDPIAELSDLVLAHNKRFGNEIGFHIDACLGGFLAPFAPHREENFGFALDGVTSVSCDVHKYGLAPKGAG